ncbi:MAG: hypothetical protein RR276_09015 [Angelakisella sp.]
MMLKLTGLLLLFSSAVLTGMDAANRLMQKEHYLRQLGSFFRQFAIQLDCLRCSPAQLVLVLSRQQEFYGNELINGLLLYLAEGISFKQALRDTLKECHNAQRWGVDRLLWQLEDTIGVRELETQLAVLHSVVAALEEQHAAAAQQVQKKGSLYRRMGVLTGLLLAVFFC